MVLYSDYELAMPFISGILTTTPILLFFAIRYTEANTNDLFLFIGLQLLVTLLYIILFPLMAITLKIMPLEKNLMREILILYMWSLFILVSIYDLIHFYTGLKNYRKVSPQ